MWLDEVRKVAMSSDEIYEHIASHHKPVMIYGTGNGGRRTTELLMSHGIEVSRYITDTKYLPASGEFLGKPVVSIMDKCIPGGDCVIGVGPQAKDEDDFSVFHNIGLLKSRSDIHLYGIHEVISFHEPITYTYLQEHKEEFDKIYGLLCDEKSKDDYIAYLKGMVSGVPYYEGAGENQYFNELTRAAFSGTYVDCGAYIGDTIEKFIECSNGLFDSIYAIEADPENLEVLYNLVERKKYRNIEIIPKGAGSFSGRVFFDGSRATTSTVSTSGDLEIEIDTIDNIVGNHSVTFLKMDIEGSEQEAIKGAQYVIETNMPTMAICVYHRRDDLLVIPTLIEKYQDKRHQYRFFLRKHRFATHDELVLYAIPML